MAGGAMGLGMGAGFGMMMPGMIQQAMAGGAHPAPGTPQPSSSYRTTPAGGAAAGVSAGPDFTDLVSPVTTDPKSMVRSVAAAAGYTIAEAGQSLAITVPIGSLRKQLVTVEFGKADESGHSMVNYWSICGPATEKNAMALLRHNTEMVHGAFAAKNIGGTEMIVIQANQLAETIDPLEVSRVLSAVAWQADQVEQKLVGEDQN